MPKPFHRIVSGIRSLEPWPPVASRVLEIAGAEDAVPGDVVKLIQTDPALTAKVLKLCNSAFYGFQREVTSLSEAGNKLGVDTLVNLVLTSCMGRYFPASGDSRARETWERSVRGAVAAGVLARARGDVDPDAAYTAALLSNIGFVVVDRHLGDYRDAVDAAVMAGLPRLVAEREVLGLDHAHIGARLARSWGLPDALVDSIANHHTPDEAEVDPLLSSVSSLAESLTHLLDGAQGGDDGGERVLRYELSEQALARTGLDRERLAELEGRVAEELERARALLDAL